MTDERKTELLEKCVEWICEHITEAEDRFEALSGHVGFTLEELHEFGVDDLDGFSEKELDYWKLVKESIENEYAAFKAGMIKDGEAAFNNAHEISVKTEFYCAISGDVEFDDKVYKPGASVNTFADTEEFIEGYCERNYPDIMNEEEEPPRLLPDK